MTSDPTVDSVIHLLNNVCCDVTFVCGGKKLHASRKVLSKACPYFQTLLNGSFPEAKQSEIELSESLYGTLSCMIKFASTGELNTDGWDVSEWKSLFCLAHEYQWCDLLNSAADAFSTMRQSLKSLVTIMKVGEKLDIKKLCKKCWNAIDFVAMELVQNQSLFDQLPPEIVLKLVQRKTLFVDEEKLLSGLARWMNNHTDQDPIPLLTHIRWEQIKEKNLRQYGLTLLNTDRALQPRAYCFPSSSSSKLKCMPNVNLAKMALQNDPHLVKRKAETDSQAEETPAGQKVEVKFDCSFLMNTVKFRLINGLCGYSVSLSFRDSFVQVAKYKDCDFYQEIYFEKQFVDIVTIEARDKALKLDSLECSFSFTIPKNICGVLIPEKNKIIWPESSLWNDDDASTNNDLHLDLCQTCYVSTVAVFLQKWPSDRQLKLFHDDEEMKVTKIDKMQRGLTLLLVYHFEQVMLSSIDIEGVCITGHIMRVECPADATTLTLPGLVRTDVEESV